MNSNVTFSAAAWHSRLYDYMRWSPNHKSRLCPYFWLTIAGLFAVAPVFVYREMAELFGADPGRGPLRAVGSRWAKWVEESQDLSQGRQVLRVFSLPIAAMIVAGLIFMLFGAPVTTALGPAAIFGVVTLMFAGLYGIMDLVVPFLKAQYEQRCPYIDWEPLVDPADPDDFQEGDTDPFGGAD